MGCDTEFTRADFEVEETDRIELDPMAYIDEYLEEYMRIQGFVKVVREDGTEGWDRVSRT